MHPVKIRYDGSDRRLQFEALVLSDPSDHRIFLTNHALNPERALCGHELTHKLRRERPELYDELVRELASAGVNQPRWAAYVRAMREQTRRKEGKVLSDEEIREDGVANLVGDMLLDPVVWNALQRPSLRQRVWEWIASVWQRLAGAREPANPLGGGNLVLDRTRALEVVSGVLVAWASAVGQSSPTLATVGPDEAVPPGGMVPDHEEESGLSCRP
jgi:hypothetical protein